MTKKNTTFEVRSEQSEKWIQGKVGKKKKKNGTKTLF